MTRCAGRCWPRPAPPGSRLGAPLGSRSTGTPPNTASDSSGNAPSGRFHRARDGCTRAPSARARREPLARARFRAGVPYPEEIQAQLVALNEFVVRVTAPAALRAVLAPGRFPPELLPWPVALDEIIEVGAVDGLLFQGEVFVRPPVIDPEAVRPRFGAALPFLEEDLRSQARSSGLRGADALCRFGPRVHDLHSGLREVGLVTRDQREPMMQGRRTDQPVHNGETGDARREAAPLVGDVYADR